MAEGSTLQHTVLIKDSFDEINSKIRQKVLDNENISSRGSCGGLVRKYRKWSMDHSLGFQDHYSSSDDNSSSDDEEGEEAVPPVWIQHYMEPTKYIPTKDDDNNSDDGFDTDRQISRKLCNSDSDNSSQMMMMLMQTLQSKDTKDSYVESFMESIADCFCQRSQKFYFHNKDQSFKYQRGYLQDYKCSCLPFRCHLPGKNALSTARNATKPKHLRFLPCI